MYLSVISVFLSLLFFLFSAFGYAQESPESPQLPRARAESAATDTGSNAYSGLAVVHDSYSPPSPGVGVREGTYQEPDHFLLPQTPLKVATPYRRPRLVARWTGSMTDINRSTIEASWDGVPSRNKPIVTGRDIVLISPQTLGNGTHTAELTLRDGQGKFYILTWQITISTPGLPQIPTGLWVEVNQKVQRIYILKGNKVLREIICSTGKPRTPTPNGVFRIQNRGRWFVTKEKTAGAKYWVSFKGYGRYMFHSVIYTPKGILIKKEAAKLGQKASHGCIRMPLEEAKWFYEQIPAKTPVVIHEPK